MANNKKYQLDLKNNSLDNAYSNPKLNPDYGGKFTDKQIHDYKESVYDKISELLLSQYSQIEPFADGNDLSSLQKTYKDGKLVVGRDVDDLMVVYESDIDANADDEKIEKSLLNWLEFADISQLKLRIVRTAEVTEEGKPSPPNLILEIPNKSDFNLNEIIGTIGLKDVNLKDNVSQFMGIDKVSTDISRKKLSEHVEVDFSELSPITFTHLIQKYNKAKKDIPLFRYRSDDFFKEYINSQKIPLNYRVEKLFEEFERIKQDIPPGALAPYEETVPLLTTLTDEQLFGWETLTYLVAESQKLIGTINPIYSQQDAITWQSEISGLTQYGATMSGSWDECEKRWRALSDFPIDETVEEEMINGCTDSNATNYNELADVDDGTCVYGMEGIQVYARGTARNYQPQGSELNPILILGEGDDSDLAGRTVYSSHTIGHSVTVISAQSIEGGVWDGTTLFDETYNTFPEPTGNVDYRTEMAEDILNGTWSLNDLFIITSFDAVGYNDLLVEALKSVGGCYPRLVNGFGSTNDDGLASANARTPYVLVGSKGLGPCGGYEAVGDDGEFTPPVEITKFWNPFVNQEGGWDIDSPDPIYGCTDSSANNYNQYSDTDDGSCTYDSIMGCTDPLASNYNIDAEEDDGSCMFIVTPAFEETFDDWKDIYSPSDYFFRSVEDWDNQEYSIGQVLKTDGPEGASDTAVRIYRTRPSGQWPGALYNSNSDSVKTDPTWVGAEARKPRHVYLEEDRTYTWSGWGRCNTTDGKANVFVGDTRGGDSENNWDYSWRQDSNWDTNGEWEFHEFDFTPVRNKHVSKGKFRLDYMVELDGDGNWKNIGAKPTQWNPSLTPDPWTDYIVKTDYILTVNKEWSGGTMRSFLWDFGSDSTGEIYSGKNNMKVRVLGQINITNGNNWKKFGIVHDDGVRLYIDGELIIDDWRDTPDRWDYSDEIQLSEGLHDVEIHMYENEGHAALREFRMAQGSYGTITDANVKDAPLVEHAPRELITDDDVQQNLYPGVMMNMYLYPGTTNGGTTGQYCDYANIKVTPKPTTSSEMRRGGMVRKLAYGGNVSDKTTSPYRKARFTQPIPSNYNPGPTREVNRDVNILRNKYEEGGLSKRSGRNRRVNLPRTNFNLNERPKSNIMNLQNSENLSCVTERNFLNKISTLSLNQMASELRQYLKANTPCLSAKIDNKYHLGGEVGHNSNTPGHLQEHGKCCHTVCGDWNGDGTANVSDVVGMIQTILQTGPPVTQEQLACTDSNNDGIINIFDVLYEIDILLGYSSGNCDLCQESLCSGIIGCDGVCYTEWQGQPILGPNDITFLPEFARFDKAGECGGMSFNCNDVCSSYDMSNCEGTMACHQMDIVQQNQDGEFINIIGTLETTSCQYDYGDGICMYGGSGERGGLLGGIR